jgi:hypothetical protein
LRRAKMPTVHNKFLKYRFGRATAQLKTRSIASLSDRRL